MTILEPIEESDLDLESKFKGGKEKTFPRPSSEQIPSKVETEKAREVISAEKDNAYGKILSKVQSKKADDHGDFAVKKDAQTFMQKEDADSQVQHLVDVAMEKGVVHAVKVARHLEDNYVLDMFHDRLLVDELHEALLRKGLIEKA